MSEDRRPETPDSVPHDAEDAPSADPPLPGSSARDAAAPPPPTAGAHGAAPPPPAAGAPAAPAAAAAPAAPAAAPPPTAGAHGAAPPPSSGAHASGVSKEERNLGLFCHLSTFIGWLIPLANILAPLIIWLVKKDESAYVDHHGREALNFQINVTFWAIIFGVLSFLLIGIPFLVLLILADLVLTIVAAVKASEGELYQYPATLRLVK